MSKKEITAIELRAPKGSSELQIDWADGHTGIYPHEVLRGYCPCADCQGHEGPISYVEGGNLELVDIQEVGNYALRLVWGDKHGTGLYSFNFLRQLCTCPECGKYPLRERVFPR
ncbi:MAG: DUF971 domain-containing protein [Myxococcales bacterium]|nr:MAG: DUF971 domain-containing protein [Myxococcales bacterium]